MFRKSGIETSIEFIRLELKQRGEAEVRRDAEFKKHIEHEEEILADIREQQGICPEGLHIQAQNGKIDRIATEQAAMSKEISEQRGTIKFWCWIFSALIASLAIGTFVSTAMPKIDPICKAHQKAQSSIDHKK